ncbi:MAG TPA: hypothetical protein VGG08_01060 [Solirubrobacteraceae bacterium]|jgi:hypothetical protein
MCAGCAITAASAASGFRTWMQTHNFSWLTPRRMRNLTVAAMCAAGVVSTIGFSGATPARTVAPRHHAAESHSRPS